MLRTDGSVRPPRVVHVIEPALFGGAESVVTALAEGAAARGWPVSVAAISQAEDAAPAFPRLRAAGVVVHDVCKGRRRYLAEVRALAKLLRHLKPDIVHTHVYHADLVGTAAARFVGIPSVATVHGWVGGDWRNRLYETLDLLALRGARRVLCVSESAAARVRGAGVAPERVRVVSNGWPGTRFLTREEARARLGIAPTDKVVGWIGRLSEEKGPDLFLDAVLPWVGDDRRALLIGDGVMRDTLKARLAKSEGGSHVHFAGAQPEAGVLMLAFDALVLSSRTEGVPMVLLDAMAARLPIVAFAVGGIPSVLDSSMARLVPAGDAAGLQAAVADALIDVAAAEQRAESAAQVLHHRFGLERWLREVYASYDEALGLR